MEVGIHKAQEGKPAAGKNVSRSSRWERSLERAHRGKTWCREVSVPYSGLQNTHHMVIFNITVF